MRQKVEDRAEPFFTRLYGRHRRMVKALQKEPGIKSNADIARIAIEELYKKRIVKKKEK